jgi:cellulose synthase/poly-beta-1,6-N-acetylglucosamine synthase-like glycosyltransferase
LHFTEPPQRYLQRRRNKQGPAWTYEVIIVDDGSRDATPRVALDYARRHGTDAVRLLRMPHNRGKVCVCEGAGGGRLGLGGPGGSSKQQPLAGDADSGK